MFETVKEIPRDSLAKYKNWCIGTYVDRKFIFLKYNNTSHKNASEAVNNLCWKPDIQESKDSEYAADNIRYKYQLKAKMIAEFVELYSKYFDPKNIRYIF
jgi:hypothetical protein